MRITRGHARFIGFFISLMLLFVGLIVAIYVAGWRSTDILSIADSKHKCSVTYDREHGFHRYNEFHIVYSVDGKAYVRKQCSNEPKDTKIMYDPKNPEITALGSASIHMMTGSLFASLGAIGICMMVYFTIRYY